MTLTGSQMIKDSLPKISVIMSAYNAEAFIGEALGSILNQTFTDFEVIIIDDHSTDKTVEIIQSLQDDRIKLIRNETNLGLTINLNKAINLSSAKYLLRMDADDVSMPDRFQVQYDFMETHPEVGIAGSWYETFGKDSVVAKYKPTHREIVLQFLYECHVCHPTIIIRKETLLKNQIFYNPNFIAAQDYDLMSRVSRVAELANIPRVLLKYRWHADSISSKKREIQLANKNKVISSQLQQMGVMISQEEIDLFLAFCNAKFDFDKSAFLKIESLLLRMIEANRKSQYLNPLSLEDFLTSKWFHALYNSSSPGVDAYNIYFSSRLLAYRKTGLMMRLKFLTKTLFARK